MSYIRSMKKQETAADRLNARAREVRLQREAAEARQVANRRNRRRMVVAGLAAAPVGFLGLCVALALVAPAPSPNTGPDWRTKVGQATPAELAAQPAQVKEPAPKAASKPEEVTESDPLGDWAVRAHAAQQAHQDRCWDQLEERGYGDASCY